MPLYLFVLFILVGIVAILSRFMLHEPAYKVLLEVLQWNVFIKADINGLSPTWLIIAGVVWSLPYEWFFYFTLPFYGLLLRVRSSWTVLAFALTGSLFFLYIILNFYQSAGGLSRMLPFLSGIAAAFLARSTRIKKLVSGILPSAVIAVFLILGVGWFRGVDEPIPLLLVSAAFIAIACGNSLFGILTHPLSRTLGQISYSIYLLHGIILFVIFTWVLGYPYAMTLSPLEHWVVIAVCSIGVVTISSLTYFFIEKPALEAAPRVADKIAISPL